MGLWAEQVVPRVVDRALDTPEVRAVRERVCAGLVGEVLEVGFGSGLNVPHYPPAVRRVTAVEPSDVGWRLAGKRLATASVGVDRSGLDGQSLPFADGSFDSALSTFTLCTIPDVGVAVREIGRVLRPGGRLHFVEHGRSPDEAVRRWQERLEPAQRRLMAGCHLARPIDELLTAAGFVLVQLERYDLPGQSRVVAHLYEGVAAA